jgi:ribonuclease P/MRP protein subunit RPP40
VQRRETRCIPSLQGLGYEERLRKLNLPSLCYRRARGDMIEVYKMLNMYDPQIMPKLKLNKNQTIGHSFKLSKSRAQKDVMKFYFSLRIKDMWNSLPNHVVESDNLLMFKNRLDRAWLNEQFKFQYRASPPGAILRH